MSYDLLRFDCGNYKMGLDYTARPTIVVALGNRTRRLLVTTGREKPEWTHELIGRRLVAQNKAVDGKWRIDINFLRRESP